LNCQFRPGICAGQLLARPRHVRHCYQIATRTSQNQSETPSPKLFSLHTLNNHSSLGIEVGNPTCEPNEFDGHVPRIHSGRFQAFQQLPTTVRAVSRTIPARDRKRSSRFVGTRTRPAVVDLRLVSNPVPGSLSSPTFRRRRFSCKKINARRQGRIYRWNICSGPPPKSEMAFTKTDPRKVISLALPPSFLRVARDPSGIGKQPGPELCRQRCC